MGNIRKGDCKDCNGTGRIVKFGPSLSHKFADGNIIESADFASSRICVTCIGTGKVKPGNKVKGA